MNLNYFAYALNISLWLYHLVMQFVQQVDGQTSASASDVLM